MDPERDTVGSGPDSTSRAPGRKSSAAESPVDWLLVLIAAISLVVIVIV